MFDKLFNKMLYEIETSNLEIYGIEIHKENQLIFRHFFSEDIRYPIYSATKTITSAAAGLAYESGKLDIKAPISYYLDRKHIDEMPKLKREAFEKLSIERFLTMSVSGFPFRPEGDNWLKYSLSSNDDFSEKPVFQYSNISAYLVGLACENAVGEPLYNYICRNILAPLSIQNPPYAKDPDGNFYGATGFYLTVDELSRFGSLYLNGGIFNGERIISREWIEKSVTPHIKTENDENYGYFIWLSDDLISISGKWGQKCLIFPSKKITVTYLSNLPVNSSAMLKIALQTAERL